jgi:hypothetical protein
MGRRQPKLDRHIRPVSDFRANAAELIEREVLSDIRTAVGQIDDGKGVSNRAAKAELRRRFTP